MRPKIGVEIIVIFFKMKRVIFFMTLLMLGFTTVSLTSCTKDEEEVKKEEPKVDVREQSIGSYKGEFNLFQADDTSVVVSTWSEDFEVKKDPNNATAIDFIMDGEPGVKGVKVAEASNGFSFDILKQTIELDGESYEIEGVDMIDLGGVKYHGAYHSGDKEIGAAMTITVNGVDMFLIFYGEKK
jgi:hypothetical protein